MKKIFIFLAAVVGVGLMASCNRVSEFNLEPFASFYVASATISESATATNFSLPVLLYNVDEACSVTYKVEPVSATEGVDYTVKSTSGVLNFAKGEKEQSIDFSITGQPGVYTGSLKFVVKLEGASNGVSLGNYNTCTITIADKDLKVDWDYLSGVWNAQDYDAGKPDGGAYKVQFTKVDETTIALTNLWGGGETIIGTVSFSESGSSASIAFDARQVVYDATDDGFGELILIGTNASGSWAFAPAKAKIDADGFVLGPWNMLITAGQYEGYIYGDSYSTEFTK